MQRVYLLIGFVLGVAVLGGGLKMGTGPICAQPGTDRKLVAGRSGKLDLSPFPAAADANASEINVPLNVDVAPGTQPPAGWPVTTGVPLGDGWLRTLEGLEVQASDGHAVPAQFHVRGRYPKSGCVRWLGVDFQLLPGIKQYRLMRFARGNPKVSSPVRVITVDDALIVTTGPLKAEVPKRGGMLRRVWLDDRLVVEQSPSDGNCLTTVQGKRFAGSADSESRAAVELEGPLHTVIRVEGRYIDAKGQPCCRWAARLHFFAGQPTIQITHTFTWIGKPDELKIRDLALSFGLKQPAPKAMADESAEIGSAAVIRPIGKGRMLSLLQDQHWHWGHGDSHFGVFSGDPDEPEEVATGRRAGSWLSAGGVTLVMRELWQQFPKELRAAPQRLTAYLWSSNGKADVFDLSYDGLERFWGPAIVEQFNEPARRQAYLAGKERPATNDPTGMAKSHDLLLVFHEDEPGPNECAQVADTFDRPPLVLPDPEWTFTSEVVGRLAPRDRQRFPEYEAWIDRVWKNIFNVNDDWGDYGFYSYGAGPHQAYTIVDGRAVASVWRYTTGVEYGFAKGAWLGYLRSGDRRFYETAAAHTRYLNDVMLCHETGEFRHKGNWAWYSGTSTIPWTGPAMLDWSRSNGHHRSFGMFIEHALLHYYLTGDSRSLEVVREYAAALKKYITSNKDWAKKFVSEMNDSGSRWAFQRLDELAVLYEQFGDPWFLDESIKLADELLDSSRSTGIHHEPRLPGGKPKSFPVYIFYKGPNLLSYMRNLDGPALERAREAFLKMADYNYRIDTDYRTVGLRMAYAYYLTGDPRYLALAVKRLNVARQAMLLPPSGDRQYTTRLGTAMGYNAIVNYAYLIGALRDGPMLPPAPPEMFKAEGLPPAEFVFQKEDGQPLLVELAASEATYTGPDGKPLPAAWLGNGITYTPYHATDVVTYRNIEIPAAAPAGEFRVRVDRPGRARVFATNARRAVMAAPDGFRVGGTHDEPWYFRVPEGASRLRLIATKGEYVLVRDPHGTPAELKSLDGGRYEVAVPTGAAGRVWSIQSTEYVEAAFTGMRPAFAYRDPKLLFVPKGMASVEQLAGAEDPDAVYRTGRRGKGLQINRYDRFSVRLGDAPAPGVIPMNPEEGTIEFWLKTNWDQTLVPHGVHGTLIHLEASQGSFHSSYYRGLTSSMTPYYDIRGTHYGVGARPLSGPQVRDLRWFPDRWMHVALVWYKTGRGFNWRLFIDGRCGDPRRLTGGPGVFELPKGFEQLLIGAGGDPRHPGALDVVIDDLRLSRTARYKLDRGSSKIAVPTELAVDEHTLALFRFDGDVTCEGFGGKTYQADLTNRDEPPGRR